MKLERNRYTWKKSKKNTYSKGIKKERRGSKRKREEAWNNNKK